MAEPVLDFTINFELNNGSGASKKRNRRSLTRDEAIHEIKRVLGRRPPKIRGYRVVLRVDRVLGPRQVLWDPPNVLTGNAKQLVDALVASGILTDDSDKYIADCLSGQIHDNRSLGPATRIRIWRESDAKNMTLSELK